MKLLWQDTTYFARVIGAARSGDVAGARQDLAKLTQIVVERNAHNKEMGYSRHTGESLDQMEAESWLAFAEGQAEAALQVMRKSVKREEEDGVSYDRIPAQEMLADMLLQLKQPTEALTSYKAALRDSPRRFNSLYGAARAAELAGNAAEAREYYATLLKNCADTADRAELQMAKSYLAKQQTAE